MRSLIAIAAVVAGLVAGVAPAAAATLTQKPGAAGCIGEAPCTVGVETFDAHSVAISPNGRQAYALSRFNGALTVFDRASDGTLTQKRGTAGCISSRAAILLPGFCVQGTAMQGAWSLAISPNGRNLYVASFLSSAVAVFDRASNGTLTQKPGAAGCISDSPTAPCADGTGLAGAQAVTVSADSVYVGASGSGAIAVFDRASNGALTQKRGLGACVSETGSGPCADGRALTGTRALGASGDGNSVYAISADGAAAFDRADDGRLTQKAGKTGCVSATVAACAPGRAMSGPTAIAVSPDGSSVYVTANASSAVAVFDRRAGGALIQKPGAAGCISSRTTDAACAIGSGLAEATAVAVGPDGASVHVASLSMFYDFGFFEGPGSIANFDRSDDGTLKQPAGAAGCVSDGGTSDPCSDGNRTLRGAASLALSPDGRNAYLATSSGLAIFDRGASRPATRPLLRGLALAPARFRASARGASLVARGGTRLSFRVSEPASVRFTVARVVSGRRAGGRCVPVRRANRAATRCDRYRPVPGSFLSLVSAGAHAMRFSGRVANRRLAAGRYRLRGVASDGVGNRSRAAVARFAITKG
jgi:DNA-binding beta-propeller fold protein YncE